MKDTVKITFISAIIGALFGTFLTFFLLNYSLLNSQQSQAKTQEDLIEDFYLTENAVHISPHGLRKKMTKGIDDFVLVDLRSAQEYEKEHIIGAINIPAYSDPNTSAYDEKERIIGEFQKLSQDKEIIVYCYSIPCMTGRKIGKMLTEEEIYVKQLGVGWNEWRYYWDLWNHDMETKVDPQDYVTSGKAPGKLETKAIPPSCGEGEFDC